MSFENHRIVKGGNKGEGCNRLLESESMLENLEGNTVRYWYELINGASSRLELVRLLLIMAEHDLHIVGSRGFVYHSMAMAKEVSCFSPFCAKVITRGLNLRQKCLELFEIEQQDMRLLNKLIKEKEIGES